MAFQPVLIGATANDGTGDPARIAFDKINDNFLELYGERTSPATSLAFYEDFIAPFGSANGPGWTPSILGAGAALAIVAGEAGRPGILRASTGTATNGYAGIIFASLATPAANPIVVGGGAIRIDALCRIPVLGTATTNEALLRCGLADEIVGVPTNGVYFTHGYEGGTMNWTSAVRVANSTQSVNGQAVVANQWTHLRIDIASNGSSASFYVDGDLLTVATGLPTTAMTYFFQAGKTNGTTSINFEIDVYSLRQALATPRWID